MIVTWKVGIVCWQCLPCLKTVHSGANKMNTRDLGIVVGY